MSKPCTDANASKENLRIQSYLDYLAESERRVGTTVKSKEDAINLAKALEGTKMRKPKKVAKVPHPAK